jgi:hypothetical protein
MKADDSVGAVPLLRGSCACGLVRYELQSRIEEAHHCHCSVCRKFHGAAFSTYARGRSSGLRVSGRDHVKAFRSTDPVTRSFCAECGSSLFFAHDAVPQLVWIAAGTIDEGDVENVKPDAHSFVTSKARWWSIDDALPQHDEQRPEYARKA